GEDGALHIPTERSDVESAWHLYVLRLNLDRLTLDRAQVIEVMRARNIGTGVAPIPTHLHPYCRKQHGYKPEDFHVAYREYQRVVSLPLHPGLSDEDVTDVIAAVKDIVNRHRC